VADAEQAPASVAVEEVDPDILERRAINLRNPDLQHDLKRSRGPQPCDDLRTLADIGLRQALGFCNILGIADRTGQQHEIVHRHCLNIRIGHGQVKHLANRAYVVADADVRRINDPAALRCRVDRGLAGALAEDIELGGRADLDVGDRVVGDEDVAHWLGQADQSPRALAEVQRLGRLSGGRLGDGRNRGTHGAERKRQRRNGSAEASPTDNGLRFHLSELPPEQR